MHQILPILHRFSRICGTLCAIFAATIGVADETPSPTLSWSLRDEFQTGPAGENPIADRRGELVWHLLRTTSSEGPVKSRKWLRDGKYVPLTDSRNKLFGSPASPPDDYRWSDPPPNNFVDEHVFAKLKMLHVNPSELCSDEQFVRRVYLDLCDILPPLAESRAFATSTDPDKRARLIDQLLQRPEYADYWTKKWMDVLRETFEITADYTIGVPEGTVKFPAGTRAVQLPVTDIGDAH